MEKQELIIGTKNQAKVNQIKGALQPLDFDVKGLPTDIEIDIIEDGLTAQENAKKKAIGYAKALNKPVLSIDNALYLNDLDPSQQPGIHVRRIAGDHRQLTDNEMLEYYGNLISELGDDPSGYWEFAICIAEPDGKTSETTIKSQRIFTKDRSNNVVAGYPLDSMQIDPATNKYISDMSQSEADIFWQNDIGERLQKFVKQYLQIK